MARVWALVLCFTVCVAFESTVAYQFTVGGSNGWAVPSGSDKDTYNQWAGRNRFQIGDTLLFKYDKSEDSVLQVSQASYSTCNTSGPIAFYTDGNTVFKFQVHGPFYFISGNQSRCQLGEKLIVVVLAPCHFGKGQNCGHSSTPVSAPSPALSPAHVPSPSPSPTASGISPPTASPSPSPRATSPSPSPSTTIGSVPSPSPTAPAKSPTTASPSPSPMIAAVPSPSPSPTVPATSPTISSPSPSPTASVPTPASSPSPGVSSPSPSPTIASAPSPPAPTPASTTSPPPSGASSPFVTPSASTPPPPSRSSVTSAFPSLLNLLIPLLFAALLNAQIATV